MSTVLYALGGGLGHFTRSLGVIHTLGDRLPAPRTVLVSPGVARVARPCLAPDLAVEELPPEAVSSPGKTRAWVADQIRNARPDSLVIDCFPSGIFGELGAVIDAFSGKRLLVARALRALPPGTEGSRVACFDAIHTVERCPPAQIEILRTLGGRLEDLRLHYPDKPATAPPEDLCRSCLVVHSGDMDETRALLELARRRFPALPRILVSPNARPDRFPASVVWLPAYPAWTWFPSAGAVVSASGFNTMEQMRGLATPHAFLSFRRRFDDQHRRARLRLDEVGFEPAETINESHGGRERV